MIPSTPLPRILRIAVLILAIAATLGVSAASVSSAHLHENSTGTNCDICFTAHAVTYQTSAPIQLLLALHQQSVRFQPSQVIAGYQLFLGKSTLTRGPPALAVWFV